MSIEIVADSAAPVKDGAARFPTCPICGQAAVNVFTLFIQVEARCTVCGWEALLPDSEALRSTWHEVLIAGLVRLATKYGYPLPGATTQRWFAADQPLSALDTLEYYLQEAARETERTHAATGLAWVTIRDRAAQRECAWMRRAVWAAIAPFLVDTQSSQGVA